MSPSSTLQTAPDASVAAPQPATSRQYVRYLFYKARPSWYALSIAERGDASAELEAVLEPYAKRLSVLRAYSTLGTRGDADFLLWMVSDRLEDFQELQIDLRRTRLGSHLETPYSYLAMTKRSQYIDRHVHADQEGRRTRIKPTGRKYLFVYPMIKKRPWYRLSQEDRQLAMDEHIRIGHEFPRVKINTTYSFGLDDQDFVVAFEAESPAEFLDLVQDLRETESSKYTLRDTPMYTCRRSTMEEILESLA